MTGDRHVITQANRLAWNASAKRHRETPDWAWQLAGFVDPSFSTLDPVISNVLDKQEVAGARVIQIGCNNGREVLSVLALGAETAVGIDQSDAFIAQAEELRAASPHGDNCRFVCADIYALPQDLDGKFDIALVTIGVLNWMPDLGRFFEVTASLLAPGGRMVIYETHPALDMFEPHSDTPFTPEYSYFRAEPFITDEEIVYDGSEAAKAPPSYWCFHTLGEIVTACVKAGLQIYELIEYPHSNREVDYDIYVDRPAQMPLCYSLVTVRP